MHDVIIIVVVIAIVVLQILMFISTIGKINRFKSIFPKSIKSYINNENYSNVISTSHKNSILSTILSAINDYLRSNKDSMSDFHLLKDIVERNCDAQEEDYQTQIPIPLYFGLGGTMLGILIGIGYFVLSGGLEALLGTNDDNSSAGIQALLGGVALAMIASFVGIVLTTIASYIAKNAKSITEDHKHVFLTWIQTTLLPNLSSDPSGALVKMSKNLRAFNDTFSKNTGELGLTLTKVNESYNRQQQLWETIQKIADKDIQQVNIELLSTLKGSIDEIGKLGDYLQGINKYQTKTTDAVEKMQKFFSVGIEQVDTINIGLKNALERFAENTQTYLGGLQESLDGQILKINNNALSQQGTLQNHFNSLLESLTTALNSENEELIEHYKNVSAQIKSATNEQEVLFKQKVNETTILVDELKNLTSIKSGISNLEKATVDQNKKIDNLTKAIERLAEIKTTGTVKTIIPGWVKISVFVGGGIVVVSCVYFLVINLLFLSGIL